MVADSTESLRLRKAAAEDETRCGEFHSAVERRERIQIRCAGSFQRHKIGRVVGNYCCLCLGVELPGSILEKRKRYCHCLDCGNALNYCRLASRRCFYRFHCHFGGDVLSYCRYASRCCLHRFHCNGEPSR